MKFLQDYHKQSVSARGKALSTVFRCFLSQSTSELVSLLKVKSMDPEQIKSNFGLIDNPKQYDHRSFVLWLIFKIQRNALLRNFDPYKSQREIDAFMSISTEILNSLSNPPKSLSSHKIKILHPYLVAPTRKIASSWDSVVTISFLNMITLMAGEAIRNHVPSREKVDEYLKALLRVSLAYSFTKYPVPKYSIASLEHVHRVCRELPEEDRYDFFKKKDALLAVCAAMANLHGGEEFPHRPYWVEFAVALSDGLYKFPENPPKIQKALEAFFGSGEVEAASGLVSRIPGGRNWSVFVWQKILRTRILQDEGSVEELWVYLHSVVTRKDAAQVVKILASIKEERISKYLISSIRNLLVHSIHHNILRSPYSSAIRGARLEELFGVLNTLDYTPANLRAVLKPGIFRASHFEDPLIILSRIVGVSKLSNLVLDKEDLLLIINDFNRSGLATDSAVNALATLLMRSLGDDSNKGALLDIVKTRLLKYPAGVRIVDRLLAKKSIDAEEIFLDEQDVLLWDSSYTTLLSTLFFGVPKWQMLDIGSEFIIPTTLQRRILERLGSAKTEFDIIGANREYSESVFALIEGLLSLYHRKVVFHDLGRCLDVLKESSDIGVMNDAYFYSNALVRVLDPLDFRDYIKQEVPQIDEDALLGMADGIIAGTDDAIKAIDVVGGEGAIHLEEVSCGTKRLVEPFDLPDAGDSSVTSTLEDYMDYLVSNRKKFVTEKRFRIRLGDSVDMSAAYAVDIMGSDSFGNLYSIGVSEIPHKLTKLEEEDMTISFNVRFPMPDVLDLHAMFNDSDGVVYSSYLSGHGVKVQDYFTSLGSLSLYNLLWDNLKEFDTVKKQKVKALYNSISAASSREGDLLTDGSIKSIFKNGYVESFKLLKGWSKVQLMDLFRDFVVSQTPEEVLIGIVLPPFYHVLMRADVRSNSDIWIKVKCDYWEILEFFDDFFEV